jgi:hypothetical protein
MKQFLQSKPGVISVVAFALLMAFMVHRVVMRRHQEAAPRTAAPRVAPAGSAPAPRKPPVPAPTGARSSVPAPRPRDDSSLQENAAYLERYYELDGRQREDRDRQGNPLTRRQNAGTPSGAGRTTEVSSSAPVPLAPLRVSLRLRGQPVSGDATRRSAPSAVDPPAPKTDRTASAGSSAGSAPPIAEAVKKRSSPKRFNPFGRVIKCELVFTIDSTNEQSPMIGLVMEPVYNNGMLVIPAGAEFHGIARPDRLRDRIFSGQEWVLVFPREQDRPNGRQLNVKGVALDRLEPDANGMTWGITDGSYGLEGRILRTLDDAEIKRFVATFLAAGTVALEARQSDRSGQESYRNTPQNAVLQGLAANFQKIADDITAEIAQHGVFIRVPAGHQFYFYPMQIIDPDAADVSTDIATVK